jgi:glycosyltransferase involved in cell wall biosynthesis
LHCIRNATAVLTFSPVMRHYLTDYAARVYEIPMNIDLDLFEAKAVRPDRSSLLVGYAGSPRQGENAFKALVGVAKRHPEVIVYYIGWNPPDLLRSIPAEQLRLVPGTYSLYQYARNLSALAPDIGLAPLGTTETDRSKNPTKYLDYSAVSCAGIYSAVEPYTMCVKHQETGWLVPDSSVRAWLDAIEALIADPDLRTRIQTQAYQDVERRFSSKVVLPAFLEVLADLIAW